MKRHSEVARGARVPFPAHIGERVYMHEFTRKDGLPRSLARWQPTVDAMLSGVRANGPIFLMVDQGVIGPNAPQRRPGIHVDGDWDPTLYAHGHGEGGHRIRNSDWILLASNVQGCVAWEGEWHGDIGAGGAVDVDTKTLRKHPLTPGYVWLGDSCSFLHESVASGVELKRTLVRLNVRRVPDA